MGKVYQPFGCPSLLWQLSFSLELSKHYGVAYEEGNFQVCLLPILKAQRMIDCSATLMIKSSSLPHVLESSVFELLFSSNFYKINASYCLESHDLSVRHVHQRVIVGA
jgi:hypothetical protein